jgi:transposase
MAAPAKTKLRSLLPGEELELQRIVKATSERLDRIRRAKALLAVAEGQGFTQAARQADFKSGDGVMLLVKRFNLHGLAALDIASGRGPKPVYHSVEHQMVIETLKRHPDRQEDLTASWSLSTLERTLRRSEPKLSKIGATTLRRILKQEGFSYQKSRSWCQTGQVKRVRKEGVVAVHDPKTEEKKE